MYIFFQNNQYLGSYYLTGSDDDPVYTFSKLQSTRFRVLSCFSLRDGRYQTRNTWAATVSSIAVSRNSEDYDPTHEAKYFRSNLCTASILMNSTERNQAGELRHKWEDDPRGPCKRDWGTSLMVKENGRWVNKCFNQHKWKGFKYKQNMFFVDLWQQQFSVDAFFTQESHTRKLNEIQK